MRVFCRVVLLSLLAVRASAQCALPAESQAWMQRMLNGWSVIESDLLALEPRPLPWMIFFDSRCAWHVSPDRKLLTAARRVSPQLRYRGNRVDVLAVAHGGTLAMPDQRKLPVAPLAFTSPY
jgi:hypothetical protein